MMKEIKRAIRLTRYGHGLVSNILGGIAILLIGLICLTAIDVYSAQMIGIICLVLGPIMILQVLYSLLYVNMVAASPRRRVVECVIPDIMNIVGCVGGFVALELSTIYKVNKLPMQTDDTVEMMVVVAIGLALLLIVYAVAYKYFVVGYIIFFFVFLGTYILGTALVMVFDFPLNMVGASAISFGIIALGIALAAFIRRKVYKKALSPMACGTTLRKALQ